MFSKIDSTNPINITQLSEEGSISFTQYVNLSKELVLLIACNETHTETTIKLFKANNLMDCIKQEKFHGRYSFSGSMTPNTFMLSKQYTRELIKLDTERFKIMTTIVWGNNDDIHALDEEYFFTVNLTSPKPESPLELRFYQWDDNGPILKQKIPLNHELLNGIGSMHSIQSLSNGQFAFHICGDISREFKVLICAFTLNQDTKLEMQIRHIITPEKQYLGSESSPTGQILALPNGHLLTYYQNHDGLQIWNTTNGECIRNWCWSDIKPKENFAPIIKITSFPDQKHLLIHKKDSLHIFNINHLTLKPIIIENLNCYGNHHILPDGKLLAFHAFENKNSSNRLSLSHFDTPQIRAYNQAYLKAKVLTFLYFANVLNLPDELSLHIISYAFTLEAKHQFIINCPDDIENNQELPPAPLCK
ncbi:MAG: hypothetical protein Q8M40_00230 [Legionella sp.]|nr:hypothetical protein [Legionella sp.]